jgi:hypothetical protein
MRAGAGAEPLMIAWTTSLVDLTSVLTKRSLAYFVKLALKFFLG